VLDTLEKLSPQDQQILRMRYFLQLPQQDIGRRLVLPLGTVKSRLHHARERFRAAFPTKLRGEIPMKSIMPKALPEYTISHRRSPPNSVKSALFAINGPTASTFAARLPPAVSSSPL
jgi:hypothetical protein